MKPISFWEDMFHRCFKKGACPHSVGHRRVLPHNLSLQDIQTLAAKQRMRLAGSSSHSSVQLPHFRPAPELFFFLKLAERKCCRAARQWTVSLVNPASPLAPSTLLHSHNFFSTWTDNGKLPSRCSASFTCHTVHASISAASLGENIQTRSRGPAEVDNTPSSCVPRDRISDVIWECF